MWTYETIVDTDPATPLNDLLRQGATLEVLHVCRPVSNERPVDR
jgi:hypothetical protein